ncbi:MAG: DUF3429 domain-containing protein [Pseudohongiellaceae bacterium]
MTEKRRAIILTFAGTLPFLLGAFFLWLDFFPTFLPASIKHIVHSYAVVITSFICGIHWGIHLQVPGRLPLFIISVVIALVMWASLLVMGTASGLFITLLGFFVLWLLDFRILALKMIPPWYFGLRTIASTIVIFCLLVLILQ